MNDIDPVLTTKEIAADLRCSKSQAHKILNGAVKELTPLPYLALGRKKVVLRSVLERWKRQNLSGIIPSDSEKATADAMH